MRPATYSLQTRTFLVVFAFFAVFAFSAVCFGQYTYVPRNLSKEGDFKVVVVPATNPRQARLDAQTYHIGWDAVEARMGQSRVMYDVLLKKRKPYRRLLYRLYRCLLL